MADRPPEDFISSPKPPDAKRSLPKLGRRAVVIGILGTLMAGGGFLLRRGTSGNSSDESAKSGPVEKPAASPEPAKPEGTPDAERIAQSAATPTSLKFETPTAGPSSTRIPTATLDRRFHPPTETPSPTPTQSERYVPGDFDTATSMTPQHLEDALAREKNVDSRSLNPKLVFASWFNGLTDHEINRRLLPEIKEITTDSGKIIAISIDKELLVKSGVSSVVVMSVSTVSKDPSIPSVYKTKDLTPVQLARAYKKQNEPSNTGRLTLYINLGGLDPYKLRFPDREDSVLDNIVDMPAEARSQPDLNFGINFFRDHSDFQFDAQGRLTIRNNPAVAGLALDFSTR